MSVSIRLYLYDFQQFQSYFNGQTSFFLFWLINGQTMFVFCYKLILLNMLKKLYPFFFSPLNLIIFTTKAIHALKMGSALKGFKLSNFDVYKKRKWVVSSKILISTVVQQYIYVLHNYFFFLPLNLAVTFPIQKEFISSLKGC